MLLVAVQTLFSDVRAESESTKQPVQSKSHLVDDSTSGEENLDADKVASEVARLQQELGGSIVTNSSEPALSKGPMPRVCTALDSHGISTPPSLAGFPGGASPRVLALRHSAWQMEASAHRLEMLDLYEQADELRRVADRLRRDARVLKTKIANIP